MRTAARESKTLPITMATRSSKPRILVVDDEPSVLLTYRLLLEQKGYSVTAVVTAREAIDHLEHACYDVLLCDLSLEEQRSGFEVIDYARNRYGDVPAALLTGYATGEAAERAEKQSIAILFKPIDIEQFFTTISALLGEEEDGQAKANGR